MAKADQVGGLRGIGAATAVVLTLLALAACSGDADGTRSDAGDADRIRGADTLTQVSPLTGEIAENGLPEHSVLSVKVENTTEAQPQVGLDRADLVAEELVEGGLTRLIAFYYSDLPNEVGPVRSMRASDIGITKPVAAVIVASGAARTTERRLEQAEIATITEAGSARGYWRDDSRIVPHNLMVSPYAIGKTLEQAEPPPPYLPFGAADDFSGGRSARSVDVAFSSSSTTRWRYDAATGWVRADSLAEPGHDFVADNVLVLRVRVGDAGYLDPAGNPVPETIFEGTGRAMLFHGGKVVTGTWTKDNLAASIELADKSGEALTVPAGRTWLELVPAAGGSVEVTD
ncbi:MAG: DUF3048 domain-containing protein [Nocardioidaceae bacterium]|nr:DUF3048 domain-containing protein [Nocardioidaceae bacterium]